MLVDVLLVGYPVMVGVEVVVAQVWVEDVFDVELHVFDLVDEDDVEVDLQDEVVEHHVDSTSVCVV